ncbi:TrmB family transcriptional regulator [Halomarina pelagica]|uniref:TrmB family transcriptional regulator n=1 Tax=Halomarina pelagica TaxID=2961599 RepID=UPI0020C217DD|nr:TrmB family transcriptional regulator [Halomarina sp. BND7]
METATLVETFREAGLSPYQARTYVALLDLGAAAATELAAAADVPSARIYDVLRDLETRGYVETYEREHLCVRAHSPAEVLEDLRSRARELEAAANEVETRWEQPDLRGARASLVRRFDTVIDQAQAFVETANHQIQLSVTLDEYEMLRPALRAAHERGVSVRVAIHTSLDASPPSESRFAGVCTEIRHRRLPGPFVALIDRHQTCFAHHADSVDRYGVLVDDRAHTYVFNWYFQTCLWDPWPLVYSDRPSDPPMEYVDLRQCIRDIAPLVADGATVRVDVTGRDLETGESRSLHGVVVDLLVAEGIPEGDVPMRELVGQAAIVVEGTEHGDRAGDRRRYTVGGWGAILEEIEAENVTVTEIDHGG